MLIENLSRCPECKSYHTGKGVCRECTKEIVQYVGIVILSTMCIVWLINLGV